MPTPFLGSGVHGWIARVALALGAPLMGAVFALCSVFIANAWLDSGSAQPRPAHVQDMTMTTFAFVFRDYELSYQIDASDEVRKLLTTPEHLMSFPDEQATAYVRPGRFGWPWVESVEPAQAAAPAADLAQER